MYVINTAQTYIYETQIDRPTAYCFLQTCVDFNDMPSYVC
jgi:hypothetical protein